MREGEIRERERQKRAENERERAINNKRRKKECVMTLANTSPKIRSAHTDAGSI